MEKHSQSLAMKKLGQFFKRFHLIIFFVFVVACLVSIVILVNQILTEKVVGDGQTIPGGTSATPVTPGAPSEITQNPIIQRSQAFQTADAATVPDLPTGRVDPFTESAQ